MIRNDPKKVVRRLAADRITLYTPVEGASYCHHASICHFKGRFYAIWSNGFVGEDECGQRVMLSMSENGVEWSAPRVLVSPEEITNRQGVLTAAGFHVSGDTLVAYFGHYTYVDMENRIATGSNYRDTFLGYVTTEDGENWTKPVRTQTPIVPNHGPQATSTGRLIISGNVMFPYSDDPSGVGEYTLAGVYGDAFGELPPRDDPDSIHMVTPARGWDCRLLCEGSFYETDDHVLHMLFRSNSNCLWASESCDDGVTWSEPVPTEFADDNSKFHCGRLPDGRYYVVSNARPGGTESRNPLVLSLSEDGEDFSEAYILRDESYDQQFEGRWKGGVYGYPHTLIHDGCLYIIYSKRKEAVEITRLPLANIPARGQGVTRPRTIRKRNYLYETVIVLILLLFCAAGAMLCTWTDARRGAGVGACAYLLLAAVLRSTLQRHHRRGIRLYNRGQNEAAIEAFRASYDFYTRHPWIDRYRCITMLSSSAMPYKHMALRNLAACHARMGNAGKALEYLERLQWLNPDYPGLDAAMAEVRQYIADTQHLPYVH